MNDMDIEIDLKTKNVVPSLCHVETSRRVALHFLSSFPMAFASSGPASAGAANALDQALLGEQMVALTHVAVPTSFVPFDFSFLFICNRLS